MGIFGVSKQQPSVEAKGIKGLLVSAVDLRSEQIVSFKEYIYSLGFLT